MPANQNSLLSFIWSILKPEQHALVSAFTMTGNPTLAPAAAPIARIAPQGGRRGPAIAKATPRASERKTSIGVTGAQMLAYFKQHPTASLNVAQLREASPFSSWRPNIVGTTAARCKKAGLLSGSPKTGWTITPKGLAYAQADDGKVDRRLTRAA